jgi:GDP-4-dehydro-6-deoxy-D-mannose reductase
VRVLVTGVSGFLGPHLARHLLARGHAVAGTYLGPPPELDGVELLRADLLEAPAVEAAVQAAAPEVLVHLAGLSHVGESWARMGEYFRVNFLGTEQMLRAAGRVGARFVLASSSEVYGLVPESAQPINEERPLDPRTPYALTKAAAERLVLAAGGVVVRTFNMVGPGQAPTFALPAFAAQLAAIAAGAQAPVLRVGNLAARRDFVHVADAAEGYGCVAERGEVGGVYNLASGRAASIEEALRRLLAVAGVEARVEPDPERLRPVDLPLLCGDPGRLRGLGWAPRRSLDEALRDLWCATPRPARGAGEVRGEGR